FLVPFTNSGTVAVTNGALRFQSTFTQNGGTLSLANGATLQFDNGLSLSAGKLVGNGTVVGNVSSASFISPSAPNLNAAPTTGTLSISGNLALLAASTLLFEFNGSTPGPFDLPS